MIGILVIVSQLFVPLMNAINAQNIGGPGGVLDQTSDNNANVSFLSGEGKMTFSTDNVTVV